MAKRQNKDGRGAASEPALRVIMRRLREIMGEPGDGQSRLDHIVQLIAGIMVAEVCSIYLKRQDGSLELFATEGLNRTAVHNTFMRKGEGLVGRCAELATPVNEPDAQNHPAFSYRPETGEEVYHSLLAVPILRAGEVLGVLTVQNRTHKEYSDEDVEILETTAMVLAEHIVSGAVAGSNAAVAATRAVGHTLPGQPIAEGIAIGYVALHDPRVVVTDLTTEDPEAEMERLIEAVGDLRTTLDELIEQGDIAHAGEHRDVLEAYRMLANDRGWVRRLKERIEKGLTAEAAVEQVQNETRSRLQRHADPIMRERLRDFDELSDRLLRVLDMRRAGAEHRKVELPQDAVLVARTMGPADLLDYDRSRLKGLIIEDGGGQSHVAIVARALGIAAVGQARGVIERVDPGDPIIVDADAGQVLVRPSADIAAAYAEKVRFSASRRRQYEALRELPAVTRDNVRIELNVNAGLLIDVDSIAATGADGIGLFRTELEFMVSPTLPRLERQVQMYRTVLDQAAGRPVVFRTLDIGADKVLPYIAQEHEINPALGWRAIRMSLDRPALFRIQVRALIRAAAGRELRVMVPMAATVEEIVAARALLDRELEMVQRRYGETPASLRFGAMIEVPSLLFELEAVLPKVDFVSVGSNDLLQYLFAADRDNERVSGRYDPLSVPALRALALVPDACRRHNVQATLCGEIGGRPLEALALIALGYRSLSVAPLSVGPIKAMIRALEIGPARRAIVAMLATPSGSLRERIRDLASGAGVPI